MYDPPCGETVSTPATSSSSNARSTRTPRSRTRTRPGSMWTDLPPSRVRSRSARARRSQIAQNVWGSPPIATAPKQAISSDP